MLRAASPQMTTRNTAAMPIANTARLPRSSDRADLHIAKPEDAAVILQRDAAGLRLAIVRRVFPFAGVARRVPFRRPAFELADLLHRATRQPQPPDRHH